MMARLQGLDRRTLIALIGAVIVLLIASVLYAAFSRPAGAPPVLTHRTVVVAAIDIPTGTLLTASMLAGESRPIEGLAPDAIDTSRANDAIGATSLVAIPKGTTVTASRIGHPAELGLDSQLRVGERAVAIEVDRVKAINGLIQPGDRVDVIAIVAPRGELGPEARTILRDIKVLAIGQGTTAPAAGASPAPNVDAAATATLDVTPEQADTLAVADANSQLRLALRSPKEGPRSQPVEPVSFIPILPAIVPAAAAGPAPAAAPASPAPHKDGVEIIDGDKVVSGA
jgi:pilus assembly protein CpaB